MSTKWVANCPTKWVLIEIALNKSCLQNGFPLLVRDITFHKMVVLQNGVSRPLILDRFESILKTFYQDLEAYHSIVEISTDGYQLMVTDDPRCHRRGTPSRAFVYYCFCQMAILLILFLFWM